MRTATTQNRLGVENVPLAPFVWLSSLHGLCPLQRNGRDSPSSQMHTVQHHPNERRRMTPPLRKSTVVARPPLVTRTMQERHHLHHRLRQQRHLQSRQRVLPRRAVERQRAT